MKKKIITFLFLFIAYTAISAQNKDNYSFVFENIKDATATDADAQKCEIRLIFSDKSYPIVMMFNRDNGEKENDKLMGFIICDDEDILHFPTVDNSTIYTIGMKECQGKMQLRITIKKDDGSGTPKPYVELFNKEGDKYEQGNNEEYIQLLENAKNKRLKLYNVDLF